MSRITALFVGIAVLATTSVVAEAADGCGRGWYYNGRRCVPQDESGYYRPGYRRDYYEDRGPQLRLDLGGRRDEARYIPPNPSFRTWNHCPQNYTVQDGLCKPYTGRKAVFGEAASPRFIENPASGRSRRGGVFARSRKGCFRPS